MRNPTNTDQVAETYWDYMSFLSIFSTRQKCFVVGKPINSSARQIFSVRSKPLLQVRSILRTASLRIMGAPRPPRVPRPSFKRLVTRCINHFARWLSSSFLSSKIGSLLGFDSSLWGRIVSIKGDKCWLLIWPWVNINNQWRGTWTTQQRLVW